jgi:alcohol dehydrogenase class IV
VKVLCYASLADLFKYLPASKANPTAIDVRQRLQLASWMSLWPMKLEKYRRVCSEAQMRYELIPVYFSALGLSHALGHKLGARYGIPHGITSVSNSVPL